MTPRERYARMRDALRTAYQGGDPLAALIARMDVLRAQIRASGGKVPAPHAYLRRWARRGVPS